ncbi:hypothetical protein SRB17_85790 [Streptomyces sp. RB17]|nr:hypothetical protein [Streptomyces sp. RB17]MQY40546.1 hypothetical protein [Streptomyces sp. RB17]
MSQYQLRVYTLCSPEALVAYENIWSRHIPGGEASDHHARRLDGARGSRK